MSHKQPAPVIPVIPANATASTPKQMQQKHGGLREDRGCSELDCAWNQLHGSFTLHPNGISNTAVMQETVQRNDK